MASPVYDNDKTTYESNKHSYDAEAGGARVISADHGTVVVESAPLVRALQGRHMQMIAIGGSIGAGLFVGSGSALSTGGPASLSLGFIIVGAMLLVTMQALGEMAVLYPVNGAFYSYMSRFMDPAWGFAIGWNYALNWLLILPFEITAAGITISFWSSADNINIGVWIAVFMAALIIVQVFGVRGYGEVEFVLGIIKVIACIGFIILGVIIDCGGVPTDNRGYIGAHYWHDPGAFRNGFKGFCSVFVTAAFSFGGTELAGLAAAEAANPAKSLPKATRQVFWRIFFLFIVNTFIVGLIVPSDNPNLVNASGANTKYSPFVIAINLAGIKALPSIFNVIICISVLSVANSATFGSTRTFQALAANGMAPKFLAYVDKHGRPISAVILQILCGFLAFINEAPSGDTIFTWLLALSGLSNFFVWGSICFSHIRFRSAWKQQGHSLDELPFKAPFGMWGSWIGFILNVICLVAQFYVAVWPVGASPNAETFFELYLAAPVILAFYLFWKVFSVYSKNPAINHRGWKPYLRTYEMDLLTGMREHILDETVIEEDGVLPEKHRTPMQKLARVPMQVVHAFV